MTRTEEMMLTEAYRGVYTESVAPVIQQVVQLFNQQGWQSKAINDKEGIAVKKLEGKEYDVYCYLHGSSVQFYAHAKMPTDGTGVDRDENINFNGKTEYSAPASGDLTEAVKVVIDEVLSYKLPEGPTPEDVQDFNNEQKSELNGD